MQKGRPRLSKRRRAWSATERMSGRGPRRAGPRRPPAEGRASRWRGLAETDRPRMQSSIAVENERNVRQRGVNTIIRKTGPTRRGGARARAERRDGSSGRAAAGTGFQARECAFDLPCGCVGSQSAAQSFSQPLHALAKEQTHMRSKARGFASTSWRGWALWGIVVQHKRTAFGVRGRRK